MNDGTDPRDAIIAELQAQVEYMTGAAQQIADVTDQLMDEQDRLHAVELETQELKLKAEALERENAFKREVNAVYSSFVDTQTMVLETLRHKKAAGTSPSDAVQVQLQALASKSKRRSDHTFRISA